MTHPSLGKLEMTHPSLGKLEMTHQIGIRNTLHEERFYMDGALVIASSLRNTEIKQILSVWSLQAFLRLLGRFREMTRGADRQNTYSTSMTKSTRRSRASATTSSPRQHQRKSQSGPCSSRGPELVLKNPIYPSESRL